MAGGVFINYRGTDSRGYGPLLYAQLSSRFGVDQVFLDTESIPVGSDFVSHLLNRVRQAAIVLAIIGSEWLTMADARGRRRIDDPDDWIRRELAVAFTAGVTVIPVLVDDALMPVDSQLPSDIAQLGRCQYRRLRQRDASSDIQRLVTDLMAIDPRLALRPSSGPIVIGRPPLRADAFQERPMLRDSLLGAAAGGTRVIVGDGGTGKTQLAAAAFHAALPALDVAIWITAAARASVRSAYADAYAAIHTAPVLHGTSDAEQQAGRLLAWLAGTPWRWLVVLDDVLDPAELRGLWPCGPGGWVVVTTRRRDAALAARGQVIDVDTFGRGESVAYLTAKLTRVTGVPSSVLAHADMLAADLGDLPLALSHAAATIVNDGTTCANYRRLLVDGTHRLADLLPVDPVDAGDEYAHTVSGTWALARDRADRLDPIGLAGPLLDVIAFLDPNGIPESVLTSKPVCDHLRPGASPQQARRALRNLWRLSVISHDPDDAARGVRMHALAQRAGIERLAPAVAASIMRVAADALVLAWPVVEAGTALGQALRANAAVLLSHDLGALWRPEPHRVLFRLGASLSDSGLVLDTSVYFEKLASQALSYLGADHPGTLLARQHLADARGAAGDPLGAAEMYERLLANRDRVLGADHPDTLATRGQLGWWRGMSGDPQTAVTVFDRLLTDRMRILGIDHPDTLSACNSLARWRGRTGDLAGALVTFQLLLREELRLLGPDHPDTLTTRNNLAYVLGKSGDPAGALAEVEQVLAGRLELLGHDHPRTLTTRAHLARWQGEAGDPAGALAAIAEVLADELRLYGPDHPRILVTRGHLARWRGEAGDPEGAALAFADLLADRRRVLGPDHPDTIEAESCLDHWRCREGLGSTPVENDDAASAP